MHIIKLKNDQNHIQTGNGHNYYIKKKREVLIITNILLLLFACFIILIFIIKKIYQFRVKKISNYKKTTYNGKYYEGLNDIIQFDDKSTFYSYELLDFEQTVKNDNEEIMNFLPYEDAHVIRYLTVKNQNNVLKLDNESQFIVNSMTKEPLTESQLINFSDAIIASRKAYKMLQKDIQQKVLHEIYKKANYNEKTMQKRNMGFESMNDYYKNLSKDEKNQVDQILKNNNLLTKLKG